MVRKFPSPYGEEVSATVTADLADHMQFIGMFPSPYGEEVSATIQMGVEEKLIEKFPSPYGEEVSATHLDMDEVDKEFWFPSPYGEEVSATKIAIGYIVGGRKVSVPVRGRGKCNSITKLAKVTTITYRFRPRKGKR